MEKIKNIPLILLCLLGVKMLVLPCSIIDLGAGFLFSLSFMFIEYKLQDKEHLELKQELDKISKELQELKETSESLKTNVSSIKLAQSYKQGSR